MRQQGSLIYWRANKTCLIWNFWQVRISETSYIINSMADAFFSSEITQSAARFRTQWKRVDCILATSRASISGPRQKRICQNYSSPIFWSFLHPFFPSSAQFIQLSQNYVWDRSRCVLSRHVFAWWTPSLWRDGTTAHQEKWRKKTL